ncbi:hypothetical protein PORCAN_253 [Porphyromonas crevioricanis JCM 13913]|nr:hypothetical protein PORCAN_253 [Porphyromonas crevioricanis JCM 13913]
MNLSICLPKERTEVIPWGDFAENSASTSLNQIESIAFIQKKCNISFRFELFLLSSQHLFLAQNRTQISLFFTPF